MTEHTQPNPQALANPAFKDSAVAEFEKRAAELNPAVVEALRGLGNEAIEAYASVRLYHNTLSDFVPTIMGEGLHAESALATPDAADVQFAEDLFKAKGGPYASQNKFDIYIKGERGDRKPGVFLYGASKDSTSPYNRGYGQPERMLIFAQEMAYIAAQKDGPFTEAERTKAEELFHKYADLVNGGESGLVSILAANPFSPAVFNERLGRLAEVNFPDPQAAVFLLEHLGTSEFEGIYIPGNIPPKDLTVVEDDLTPLVKLRNEDIDPSMSRFYYTSPHLKKIQ